MIILNRNYSEKSFVFLPNEHSLLYQHVKNTQDSF